jgi:hypothetical protein
MGVYIHDKSFKTYTLVLLLNEPEKK